MELRFSDDEIAFRAEVRAFIDANLPAATRRKIVNGHPISKQDWVDWQRVLNRKGWAVPHWPREHGGTGWSATKRFIFFDELQSAPAPAPLVFGTNMVGPVLIAFGNDEQKRRFLPRIANLDDWWCQGFSEPGAGSDLASLKTSARRVGDHYVVSGQKTWMTLAQHADWMFCLVRTDPSAKPQKGISMLLVDMKSPGVTLRPIQTIDGDREINELFLDDVAVPAENLVGEENKGWDYAKYLLGHERVSVARVGASRERLRRARGLAATIQAGGRPLIENTTFRERLAALQVELKALELTQMRVVAEEQANGGRPGPAASVLKIKGSEIQQAISELMLDMVGPAGMRRQAEAEDQRDAADFLPRVSASYFNLRKISIYGGTNEIQRTIIAKSVLGL